MIFRQLFDRETCTYTYLLGDESSKEAVLIDPVLEQVDRDTQLLKNMGLNLTFCLNTHVHADHITGSGLLKGKWPGCKSVLGAEGNETAVSDVKVAEGETISFGSHKIEVLSTAGHTNGCHTFVVRDQGTIYIFTGDAVLVNGCGRTDFQQGSSRNLYNNIHTKVFTFPDDALIYPAHDYKGYTVTTVGQEKTFNPRLTKSVEEFIDIMANLNLPYPAKIDASLPANLVCGLQNLP